MRQGQNVLLAPLKDESHGRNGDYPARVWSFCMSVLVGVGAFVEFFMELVGSIDRFVNGLTGATSC